MTVMERIQTQNLDLVRYGTGSAILLTHRPTNRSAWVEEDAGLKALKLTNAEHRNHYLAKLWEEYSPYAQVN